ILPGHVLVADRRTRLIFLKSVAVAVAVFVDPGEASFRRRQVLFEQAVVAGGAPSRVQRYQIERRRVGSSVIGGVRNQFEMRELAVTQFVQDLARLGIATWIVLLGLQRTENFQGAAGEF